ncbi:hypothetical protein CANARDRAFT_221999 [[Candida] arabinofermentans NRRL YB-2248]|uniref:Aminopeptidase n=1 Tax=[Candida] arabinofermentans NRRL YB-2248 TaxID=983967 RepID=A0A1E4T0J0_9ASCO|nr:hypothetical protein CANARDRAFT_221999 [[Candida] arabinofermentans NRRL YB-2248]
MSTTTNIQDLPPPLISLAFANRYIPDSYDLSFEINPVKPNYTGISIMKLIQNQRFTNDDTTDDNENFNFTLNSVELISTDSYLHVDSQVYKLKMIPDKKTETLKFTTDNLKFKDLSSDSNLTLRVHFLGVVRPAVSIRDFTRGVFKCRYKDPKTNLNAYDIISTHSQPCFSRLIFPCLDDLLIKVPIKLALTTEKKYTCISNTKIETEEILNDGRKLVVFEKTPKMTTSIFSFSVGDFEFIEKFVDLKNFKNFPIKIYTQIGDSNRGEFALNISSQILPLLESKFNVDYPLSKLDFIALPFLTDGGVENWSMIQILNDHILTPDIDDPLKIISITNMIKNVLVHEMIHMFMGNLVTFESYDYTWLNESFATFMANCLLDELEINSNVWLDQCNNELFNMKRYQGLESMKPIFTKNVRADKIQNTFSRHSYEKGIFVLRMLGNLFNDDDDTKEDNYDQFFKIIGDFIETNKYGLFKPIDLWNFMKNHELNKFGYDIPTIMNSWIRIAGYPILDIQSKNDKLIIEQHRFMYNPKAKIEDVPYQIPLFIKTIDGNLVRHLMTDRKLEIDSKDVLLINSNNITISTIKYDKSMYHKIVENYEKLNEIEQCQILLDISTIFSESYQTNDVILGLIELMTSLSKNAKSCNVTAMNIGLTLINNLSKSILSISYFKDEIMFKTFNEWLDELTTNLIDQFVWEGADFNQMSATELTVRCSILSLNYNNSKSQAICKKLYKVLMHGPKYAIPKSLILPILSNTIYDANMKEYKEILSIIKNPNAIESNVFEIESNQDIKIAAISSLGCTKSSELRQKTLNWALSNTNDGSAQLSLLGFKFQPDSYELLWNWFIANFNTFFNKMTNNSNNTSSDNSNFVNFFKSVVHLVFECCLSSRELSDKLERFLMSKKIDVLDMEYGKIKGGFSDKLKLNEANSDILKSFERNGDL